eukprot:4903744-Pleurochrysis_carterae.AAC.1
MHFRTIDSYSYWLGWVRRRTGQVRLYNALGISVRCEGARLSSRDGGDGKAGHSSGPKSQSFDVDIWVWTRERFASLESECGCKHVCRLRVYALGALVRVRANALGRVRWPLISVSLCVSACVHATCSWTHV